VVIPPTVGLTITEASMLYRWLYRSPMPRGADYPVYQAVMAKLETATKDRENTDGKKG
jgi:hypothetical protein